MQEKSRSNESENNFRELLNFVSDSIIILSRDGVILTVNKTACTLLGLTSEQLVGKNIKDLMISDASAKGVILKKLASCLKGEAVEAFEILVRVNHKTRYFELKGNRIEYFGQIVDLISLRDVTNEKKTECPLIEKISEIDNHSQESEGKYRKLYEESLDAIIIAEIETGQIVECNAAASSLFERSESELIGQHQRVLHPKCEIENGFSKGFKKLIFSDQPKPVETKIVTKTGEVKYVSIRANKFDFQGKKLIQGTFRDITDLKEADFALKQERDMLEEITENIGAGLVIVDKNYRILWANNHMKKLNSDIIDKKCFSTFNTLDKVCPDCGPAKIFEGAEFDSREFFSKTRYEKDLPCWYELIATPIRDANGNVVAALELTIDITEKKRLQSKLTEYSQKLEELVQKRTDLLKKAQAELVKSERLAAIGELAGMVGHDLRNPLTGIKNSTYFLKKKGKNISESQSKEMLDTIDKCLDYSNKIISDLLDYSREIHLDRQLYSPRLIVEECLTLLVKPEKLEIINHVSDEPKIWVDPDKMGRVFINLIKNGLEAMQNVGTLTIESREVKGILEISFTDTGIGIPDEVLPKLFTPLFTTKAKGMGFGLAICKRIIEAHGGTITVKTASSVGTTFKIILSDEKNSYGGERIWVEMPKSLLLTTTKTLEKQ